MVEIVILKAVRSLMGAALNLSQSLSDAITIQLRNANATADIICLMNRTKPLSSFVAELVTIIISKE